MNIIKVKPSFRSFQKYFLKFQLMGMIYLVEISIANTGFSTNRSLKQKPSAPSLQINAQEYTARTATKQKFTHVYSQNQHLIQ